MKKENTSNIVYLGTLYRFGYDLTVAGRTEKECRSALIKEYNRTFKEWNGCNPTSEEVANRNADIVIQELTFGKVEWF